MNGSAVYESCVLSGWMIVIGQGCDCWFHSEGLEVSALQAVNRAKTSRTVGRVRGAAGAFCMQEEWPLQAW